MKKAKSRKLAYYLLVLLGIFGAHRFYCKKPYAFLLLFNGLVCAVSLFYTIQATGQEYLMLAAQMSSIPINSGDFSGLSGLPSSSVNIGHFDPLMMKAQIIYTITSVVALAVAAYDMFQIPKWIPHSHYDKSTRGYTFR